MNLGEEVLCGFCVSELRKKVWSKQLEMVKIFIEICEKNNLKYFACGGTLIGAVRHNGYIPWDDDIDLMMPRKDYEDFLRIAPKYLDGKYFLQYNKTEKRYPNG
ncbi:MAG: LicD family protein, partial [Anaeroplasmataceae bacterium]|nr:LicD family protein [Anaeroplasmataceae bacterium]